MLERCNMLMGQLFLSGGSSECTGLSQHWALSMRYLWRSVIHTVKEYTADDKSTKRCIYYGVLSPFRKRLPQQLKQLEMCPKRLPHSNRNVPRALRMWDTHVDWTNKHIQDHSAAVRTKVNSGQLAELWRCYVHGRTFTGTTFLGTEEATPQKSVWVI